MRESDICKKCSIPCEAGCCFSMIIQSYDANGIMTLHDRAFTAGTHNMFNSSFLIF